MRRGERAQQARLSLATQELELPDEEVVERVPFGGDGDFCAQAAENVPVEEETKNEKQPDEEKSWHTHKVLWKRSYRLGIDFYELTRNFPKHEQYGLAGQLRKTGLRFSSMLARYYRIRESPDKVRMISYLLGHLDEMQVCLEFSRELGYFAKEQDLLINESGFIEKNPDLNEERYKAITARIEEFKRILEHMLACHIQKGG